MHFTSCCRGVILVACQFAFIGILLCLLIWLIMPLVAIGIFLIWISLSIALFVRLSFCSVCLKNNCLRVEKGVLFPIVLRVPTRFITGVHIIQTPIARKLGVSVCIVYTSGLSFFLFGIKHTDALALSTLTTALGNEYE